jgi:CheY-like chemotaxis protein
MAIITLMAPVVAADIPAGEPLPYNLYLANGVPLANRGQILTDPEQLEILRRQGWRVFAAEDKPPAEAIPPEEAASRMDQQVRVRFQPKERPSLSDAMALVADDMSLSLKLLARLLRDQGIQRIAAAENGRQAVVQFFRQRPDLVFLDIDMPGLDGIDVLKQIKSWSPETFVCLVSGNATMVNVKAAKTYGVDAFLVKPISGLNLQRVLSLYVNSAETAE